MLVQRVPLHGLGRLGFQLETRREDALGQGQGVGPWSSVIWITGGRTPKMVVLSWKIRKLNG